MYGIDGNLFYRARNMLAQEPYNLKVKLFQWFSRLAKQQFLKARTTKKFKSFSS